MGGQYPGDQQRTYSPDGRYWWDGYTWQPVVSQRAVGVVQRVIIFRVIGCGIVLLFLFGVIALFGLAFLRAATH
jgi:hypothetical protein